MSISRTKEGFRRRRAARGIALLIVLAVIVLASVLVVGLLSMARTDRMAARAMANEERTGFLADAALQHAMAILDKNIPQPVPPGKSTLNPTNWVINPGLLTLISGSPGTATEIPLSSNPSASYTPGSSDANLNAPALYTRKNGQPAYPLIPNGTPLRVAWVNVLQDPAQPASKGNPIIGRYAFWIDDESARVNVNLAYGKPATSSIRLEQLNPLQKPSTLPYGGGSSGNRSDYAIVIPTTNFRNGSLNDTGYPLWHPAAINLDVLDDRIDRDALSNWIHYKYDSVCNWHFLESPSEIKRFYQTGVDADDAFEDIKFDVTASSRSPEFNAFGKSRLFLESRIPVWDSQEFFQFSYDAEGPMYFHGSETYAGFNPNWWHPNVNGIQMVADSISTLLNRQDWPGMPARSFVDKWGGDDSARREADQVAWNITMWGNYAAGRGDSTWGEYMPGGAWPEGIEPMSRWLTNRAPSGHGQSISDWKFNLRLFRGKLSGKAIVPWYPCPGVGEIWIKVTPEYITPALGAAGGYYLKLALGYELQQQPNLPQFTVRGGGDRFGTLMQPVKFEYTIDGSFNGAAKTSTQRVIWTDPTRPGNNDAAGQLGRVAGSILPDTATTYTLGPTEHVACVSKEVYVPDPAGIGFNSTVLYPTNVAIKDRMLKLNGATVRVSNIKLRVGVVEGDTGSVLQMIPVWDNADPKGTAFKAPAGQTDYITIPAFTLLVDSIGSTAQRSTETVDPRLAGRSDADAASVPVNNVKSWTGYPDPGSSAGGTQGTSIGGVNKVTQDNPYSADKYAFFDYQNAYWGEVQTRPSIGMLSVVPTGMQRGLAGATLKFQPSGSKANLPDWLLLDLVSPALRPNTFMNSTPGKINLNARIYPTSGGNWDADPIQRWRPLQAVFQNLKPSSTVSSAATAPSTVVGNILNHNLAAGGQSFGADKKYDYVGEVCEISGVADSGASDWEKEGIIRNMANLLTTQSNMFKVWGMAQSIKKSGSATANFGTFDPSTDKITGEKMFAATVERYVWPGVDGVPGNGAVNSSGDYTSVATASASSYYTTFRFPYPTKIGQLPWHAPPTPRWSVNSGDIPKAGLQWPALDGPDVPTYPNVAQFGIRSYGAAPNGTYGSAGGAWGSESPNYSSSSLETASNPLRAWMRYRVLNYSNIND